MPYIKPEARRELGNVPVAATPGELNYVISLTVHEYVLQKLQGADLSYALLNEVYGVMQAAAAEFYRTVIAPYEEKAQAKNGPVSLLQNGYTGNHGKRETTKTTTTDLDPHDHGAVPGVLRVAWPRELRGMQPAGHSQQVQQTDAGRYTADPFDQR